MSQFVSVLGCGNWGKNIIRNFAELGVLKSVTDQDMDQAKDLAAQHNVIAREWAEILEDETILAVAVVSSSYWHAHYVKEALMAGKHVFVEKPLALSFQQAQQLEELAIQRNKTLMVGHILQYHPAFLKMKQLLDEGAIGKLFHVHGYRMNLGRVRSFEDVMWDCAPHDLSMLLSLIDSPVHSVNAQGYSYLQQNISDMISVQISFESGQNAQLEFSWLHPEKNQKFVLVGEKASLIFDDTLPWEQKLAIQSYDIEKPAKEWVTRKQDISYVELDIKEPLKEECLHFLDCVHTGQKPQTDAAESLPIIQILEKATEVMNDPQALPAIISNQKQVV